MGTAWALAIAAFALVCSAAAYAQDAQPAGASTEWRDDEKNLIVVQELNKAYARLPFSREHEGVLDECPFEIAWEIGPNLPVAWKGGVAGVFGDEIALVGGLWMPGRANLAYAYDPETQRYTEIPPPPFQTAYTQGIADGQTLYLIGGRSAGRNAAKLTRTAGGWEWTALPTLPEPEEACRWLGAVNIIPGKWLFITAGHPAGTPSETTVAGALKDWRLRLDKPDAQWEPMAPYPEGKRNIVSTAVVRGKLYAFGGSLNDDVMRPIFQRLSKEFSVGVPYNGVPNYRDAYCYDPKTDQWSRIRNTPFPMVGGVGIVLEDRYILLMGTADYRTYRVGKSQWGACPTLWTGYGDMVLCYDVEQDNYSRLGVMPYGVATVHWVYADGKVYGFGGEPAHGYNENTENVLQIGTVVRKN